MKNNSKKKKVKVMDTASTFGKSKNRRNVSKKAEANARRKVAKDWESLSHGVRYQKDAANESCERATSLMKDELFDGILLNLSSRISIKPYASQKRILRRIVEKRQAQSVHRRILRKGDRFAGHMSRCCVSKSMKELRQFQCCA